METKTSLIEGIRKEFASLEPAEQAKVINTLPYDEQVYLLHNVLIPGEYYPCIILLDKKLLLDEIMEKGEELAMTYVNMSNNPQYSKLVKEALRKRKFHQCLWNHLDEKRLIERVKFEISQLHDFWSDWENVLKELPVHLEGPGDDIKLDRITRTMERKYQRGKAFGQLVDILSAIHLNQLVSIWMSLSLREMKKLLGVCAFYVAPTPRVDGTWADSLAFQKHVTNESLWSEWSRLASMSMSKVIELLHFADKVFDNGVADLPMKQNITWKMSLSQLVELYEAGCADLMTKKQLFEIHMNGKEGNDLGPLAKAKEYLSEGDQPPADVRVAVQKLPLGKRLQLLV